MKGKWLTLQYKHTPRMYSSSLHCASIQMVCETLMFSSHKSSWYWLTPFSAHAMCLNQSVFAEREKEMCESNVVAITHNPLCCHNMLHFFWPGVKHFGVQTQSHTPLFKTKKVQKVQIFWKMFLTSFTAIIHTKRYRIYKQTDKDKSEMFYNYRYLYF